MDTYSKLISSWTSLSFLVHYGTLGGVCPNFREGQPVFFTEGHLPLLMPIMFISQTYEEKIEALRKIEKSQW